MKRHNKNNHAPLRSHLGDARSGVGQTKPARLRNACAVLVSVGIGFYLLAGHLDLRQLLGDRPPDYYARNHFVQNRQALSYRTFGDVPPHTQTNRSPPLPLQACIQPENVIEQNVLVCRYGEPDPINLTHNRMSAEYWAQYKVDLSWWVQHSRPSLRGSSDRAIVRQWEGAGSYLAQWDVYDNRIDNSSVCANHHSGSNSYRECRKGAKVYFKEQCSAWGKQRENRNAELGKALEERYCGAKRGFIPR